jgi:[protein-PII] uridylyltransferase
MTARTLRALWHARFKIDAAFRADPVNHRLFLRSCRASAASPTRCAA